MASLSSSFDSHETPQTSGDPSPAATVASSTRPHKMSPLNRFLFFLTAWLIVLMPFLFWWNTWFGRRLSDSQVTAYLRDDKHPRHIQHALVQVGDRMGRHDSATLQWYPEMIRLASHLVEEVRNTDAWVMGQDTAGTGFHETLLKMLRDSSPMVRGNAALSLVRFGDPSGREQIVALLQPAQILAPVSGRVIYADKPGTAIHSGGLIAKLQNGAQTTDVRSPVNGRIRSLSAATDANVAAGSEIATVAPGDDQVWEALRALYLVGKAEDLDAIRPFERELREIPDRIRQQALLTDQAIRTRASAP